MATFEYYLTGDQIGTYGSASGQGNGMQMVVTLTNVQAIGSSTDIYRIVVTQANSSDTSLRNGQWVSIYSWSESNPSGRLVYSQLNPQDDMFQGRASGVNYQVFSYSSNLVIDLRGVTPGTMTYGVEQNEALNMRMPFTGFATTPQELLPPTPCFLSGTRILTRRGLVTVEALQVGDRVWTRGHGMQRIRWIGSAPAAGIAHLAPVRFDAGVLGNDRPVWLSQQHRVLISGWQAQLNFGADEVLVAAVHLVDGERIRIESRPLVQYWHMAFAQHEIICAEGMLAESLFPGPMALGSLVPEARAEILALFPDYFGDSARETPQTTRQCLNRREARLVHLV
ncbi:Hint domain-containing protein [Pseudogemmobacter bohemicus]|uniref:Hint domain-containing protein n=1 Tax=Pseudogemmobacter bohemicus TaxID=2250708 RepID=UPI0013002707|nr:Hint domain-containing protein [Pseudogemmobacter bohemicus]